MPIHDYTCPEGHTTEHRFTQYDVLTVRCPTCGKKAKREPPSRVAFEFKGAGFYATDYQNKPPLGGRGVDPK